MAQPGEKNRPLDLVLLAFRLANVLGQVGDRLARTYGLTAQQWLTLTSVGMAGEGGISPTEIGRMVLVLPQNVTGFVDRLERAGCVRREPSPRSYRVKLTEKGAEVFHALSPVGAAWAKRAAAELTPERVEALCGLLQEYLAAASRVALILRTIARKCALSWGPFCVGGFPATKSLPGWILLRPSPKRLRVKSKGLLCGGDPKEKFSLRSMPWKKKRWFATV